jgi:hypothetical protein
MSKPGYNTTAIIVGVLIFLGLFSIPFLMNLGKTAVPLKVEVGTTEKNCVESTEFMKSSHMKLLNTWRDEVVREGKRDYKSKLNGRIYNMSLQNECLKCHTKKDQFCDRCHSYVDVSPKCWDCHLAPQPQKTAQPAEKHAVRSEH